MRAKKTDGIISLTFIFSFLGVVLGVTALITTTSLMNGAIRDIVDMAAAFYGDIIIQSRDNTSIKDYNNILEEIEAIDDTIVAKPLFGTQGLARSKEDIAGCAIESTTVQKIKKSKPLLDIIQYGDVYEFDNNASVIIGSGLATHLNVREGDKITIETAVFDETIVGNIPRSKTLNIVAIFESRLGSYNDSYILMSQTMLELLFKKTTTKKIQVTVGDKTKLKKITDEIGRILPKHLMLWRWNESDIELVQIVKLQRNVFAIIMSMVILVASFNIISGISTLVHEKEKNIAILITIGARRSFIICVFMVIGLLIGVLGTIGGVISGLLLSTYIEEVRLFIQNLFQVDFISDYYIIDKLSAVIDPFTVAIISIAAIVLCVMAAIYPAWRASKTTPIGLLI